MRITFLFINELIRQLNKHRYLNPGSTGNEDESLYIKNADLLKTQIMEGRGTDFKDRESLLNHWNKGLRGSSDSGSPSKKNTKDSIDSFQTFREFLTKQNQFLQKKEVKQSKARQLKDQLETDFSFKPKIRDYSPYSGYKAKVKERKPVWERLYNLSKNCNS